MSARPHPFALVFGGMAATRFPAIRAALGDAPALDAFLMSEPAITLLHDLRPDDGLGDDGDDFVALVYGAWRYWAAGEMTRELTADETRQLCREETATSVPPSSLPGAARYIQVAPMLVWGDLEGTGQHEPLDGWFCVPTDAGVLMVALFGVHPGRPGLSVTAVEGGPTAGTAPRPDGTPAFAPTMSGGDLAGLFAVATPDELLALAWRALDPRKE